jgi:hypothetical protein
MKAIRYALTIFVVVVGLFGYSGLASRVVHAQGNAMVQVPVSPPGDNTDACGANTFPANDDGSTGASLPFTVNFFGTDYNSLYVNNNGNVTFDGPLSTYTPFGLSGTSSVIIAPFFADVDTRGAGSNQVTYGSGVYNGHATFCVNWPGVGYYGYETDKLNDFQLLLVDQGLSSDGIGDNFQIIFNYNQVQWETGDASDGSDGLGGYSAHVGYSSGGDTPTSYELPGSGVNGAFLDSNLTSGLIYNSAGSTVKGRYIFSVENGTVINPPPSNTPPTASAGGPYAGVQGTAVSLSGATASDSDGDTLTYSWTMKSGPTGAGCTFSDSTVLNPTVNCTKLGPYVLELSVSDGTNPAVTSDANLVVFAYPTTGRFVLGNGAVTTALGAVRTSTTSPPPTVTFWSPLWPKLNPLVNSPLTLAPASFRGLASTTSSPPATSGRPITSSASPACGGSWTGTPSYQTAAPSTVPAYMGVLVSSHITLAGTKLTGDIVRIVIVKTNPGYSNAQGRSGTGTIVGTLCTSG